VCVCVCLIVCDVERSRIRRSRPDFLASQKKEHHRIKRLVDFQVSVRNPRICEPQCIGY